MSFSRLTQNFLATLLMLCLVLIMIFVTLLFPSLAKADTGINNGTPVVFIYHEGGPTNFIRYMASCVYSSIGWNWVESHVTAICVNSESIRCEVDPTLPPNNEFFPVDRVIIPGFNLADIALDQVNCFDIPFSVSMFLDSFENDI